MSQVQKFEAKKQEYKMGAEFGIQCNPEDKYLAYAEGLPKVPQRKDYYFMRSRLRDMMAHWFSDQIGLKLRGDPAVGKTSLVEQFHARMRAPLLLLSCTSGTEACQLYGSLMPTTEGGLRWVDGPVILAARMGWSLCLDEFNALDPSVSTGLNALMDGYSITIPETGEEVSPQPGFRVYATENPITSKLLVTGRNVQDAANEDRWMVMDVDYLPQAEAIPLITAIVATYMPDRDAAQAVAKVMVTTAEKTREAFRANQGGFDRPMSHRTLARWAKLNRMYQNVGRTESDQKGAPANPVIYSLQRSFSVSNAEMAEAVTKMAKEAIGIE